VLVAERGVCVRGSGRRPRMAGGMGTEALNLTFRSGDSDGGRLAEAGRTPRTGRREKTTDAQDADTSVSECSALSYRG
jgi:hypothetical protein